MEDRREIEESWVSETAGLLLILAMGIAAVLGISLLALHKSLGSLVVVLPIAVLGPYALLIANLHSIGVSRMTLSDSGVHLLHRNRGTTLDWSDIVVREPPYLLGVAIWRKSGPSREAEVYLLTKRQFRAMIRDQRFPDAGTRTLALANLGR